MATVSTASVVSSPMGEFLQLLFQGPPQHQAVLLVLGGLVLVWVALRFKNIRDDAAASKPLLCRKMSSIGMTTLVSEIDTNLSIPVNVLKISGRIAVQQLVARLQTRMAEDPFFTRFRSIAVDHDHTFVEIPDFDVSRNVFSHVLGKDESALAYVESLVNRPFDLSKPLWELHAVLDSSDAAQEVTHVVWKTHHCIGDGASQSTALVRLSDNKDQFDDMIRKMQESSRAQASKSQPKSATQQLRQLAKNTAMLTALCSWSLYVIVKKALQLVIRSEPETLFKKKGGTTKRLSYTNQYSVATTKRIGKKHHATVNDIMLNCVAGAMRKTMLAAGEIVDPTLVVRAAVPVDMRSINEVIVAAHNKFSALVLDFPIGVEDPEKRLMLIKSGMNEAKFSLEKNFTYGLSHAVAMLPTVLMKAIVRFTGSRMSVAISNVRGSSVDMDMCGGRVVGFYGFMPPPPTVNLGIAILSVGDDLGLNVLVDPCVGIDSEQFLKFAEEEYNELQCRALAEVETPEQKKDK